MNKKQLIMSILSLFLVGLLITSGTYAYFSWTSVTNKRVVINTAKNLQEYIIYDEGDSQFVGDFKASSTYTKGIHSTISLYKTMEAANVDLLATIKMDINAIGNNMKKKIIIITCICLFIISVISLVFIYIANNQKIEVFVYSKDLVYLKTNIHITYYGEEVDENTLKADLKEILPRVMGIYNYKDIKAKKGKIKANLKTEITKKGHNIQIIRLGITTKKSEPTVHKAITNVPSFDSKFIPFE